MKYLNLSFGHHPIKSYPSNMYEAGGGESQCDDNIISRKTYKKYHIVFKRISVMIHDRVQEKTGKAYWELRIADIKS